MNKTLENYDELPYLSIAHQHSHPDRLATIGILAGIQPAAIENCRVLELGCAEGGNLIPLAEALPRSKFLGIDLSARQIEAGNRCIDWLLLDNIELRHQDISGFASDEKFDYIICHGVYTWVRPEIRRRILEILRDTLAPQGIAYVSYNTYPGWHVREMTRGMMQFHTARIERLGDRVEQSRELLDLLAAAAHDDVYKLLLEQEQSIVHAKRDVMPDAGDSYLAHEHLEPYNSGVYFSEFARDAAVHGLQYIGEAQPGTTPWSEIDPQVLDRMATYCRDEIDLEQYLDFVCFQKFRASILCRSENPIDRSRGDQQILSLLLGSPLRPQAEVDLAAGEWVKFVNESGEVSTSDQALVAALLCLGEAWPELLEFSDLLDLAGERLEEAGIDADSTRLHEIHEALHQGFLRDTVELHTWRPPFTAAVSERPLASPYSRWQAEQGPLVTNRKHEKMVLDDFTRDILRMLDGRHDVSDIAVEISDRIQSGRVSIGNAQLPDLGTAVVFALGRMAQLALLVE